MKITEYALKFKSTIYVLIVGLIIVGLMAYRTLPLEADPEVQIPILLVNTLYPGVAPADMERLVTNVLERKLKDLKNVKEMTSTSAESVSLIHVEFESGIDLDNAYQKMRDKISQAKRDLPKDAEEPLLIEINISEFPMMLINISGNYGLARLKRVAEDLKEDIEQIKGVLGVDLTGGLDREIQIYLDPTRLEHYKIAVNEVITRIQQEHLTTPAGNLELGQSKYAVRVPGEYKNVQLMEQMVIKSPAGQSVKLKDIGRVVDGYKERETISRINGQDCVTLRIKKRAGANIVDIADEIRTHLDRNESSFPAGTAYTIRQDNSKFIRDTVADLENSIITGLIFVVLVLFFSMGIRNAFFVSIAIPLSMLLSFIVLQAMGITLNMVVLFSLILALGMLVDNSIVVVENIFRHVSEGASRQRGALIGTLEVAWPIIASTATTVVVFAPLLFWPGIMGEFMSYLPITVITVLTSSLFVALIINPVVASDFLKAKGGRMFDEGGEVRGRVLSRYKRMLEWSLDHPKTVLGLGVLTLAGSIALYALLGAGIELFPNTTPERAQAIIKAPQGTVLQTTDQHMRQVEKLAGRQNNIKDIVANVGMGGGFLLISSGGGSTHEAVADLEFKDRHERTHSTWDTIKSLRQDMTKLAGGEFRVEAEKMGPPAGAPVSVEISGDDYLVLNRYADQVKRLVATIPNVVDLKDDFEGGKPEVKVTVDREKAMQRGVSTAVIAMAVRTAINGTEASVLREGDEEYDILVRYDAPFRKSIKDILDIKVSNKDEVQIPLRDVARVVTSAGLGAIKHIEQKRTVLVSADVSGRSSSEVMIDVKQLLGEKLSLPPGYQVTYSGEDEMQEESTAFLSRAFLMGILLIFLILVTQFNSVMRPAIIMSSVIMSLVGVFVGLVITHNKFGVIMTGMGVISLAGVVVNNAIVLIDYADRLIREEKLSLRAALVRAGVVRFRPVLLTAITTVLGLAPMSLGFGVDFRHLTIETGAQSMEWWGPMAQAVSFGLICATVLTLIMVPTMYLSQERAKLWLKDKLSALLHLSPVEKEHASSKNG